MRRRRRRGGYASDRLLRPELLWRVACYGLLILVLAAAECSFFARLRFLPAAPDLLLGAVVAVSLLDHRRASAVFAIAAGLVLDAVGGVGIPLTALIYWLIALLAGGLGEKMLPRYGSFLALLVPSILAREAWGLLEILLLRSGGVKSALLEVLLPDAAITAVFALPLYFLVKLCMIPFRERRR